MEGQETMAVDEAYVSGNLSSGGFSSLGGGGGAVDEKDSAVISKTAPPQSLDSEVGAGERKKLGSKGRDAIGKGLSSGRRKNIGRRSGSGGGEGGKVVAKNVVGTLPTPTTQLSQQIREMGLMSPALVTPGGKRTLAERADDMSPMSDTETTVGGGGPSLNDPGYSSMPHGPSSLETAPPLSLGGKEKRREGISKTMVSLSESTKDTRPSVPKSQGVDCTTRDESPAVPPVAENVEVTTGPSELELLRQREAVVAGSLKRSAPSWERQGAKNPRLTKGPSAQLLHRPIKVPTIVSPGQSTVRLSPSSSRLPRHRRSGGRGGLSPERPGPSSSPLSSMEEGDTATTPVVSPSHPPSASGGGSGGSGGGGGPVNFHSIEELSRSDKQPDMDVDPQHNNPRLAKVVNMIRSSRENANFSSRFSAQQSTAVRGISPSPSPINSLQSSARSVSPHSPCSPHTSLNSQSSAIVVAAATSSSPSAAAAAATGGGGDDALRVQATAAGRGNRGGGGTEEEAEAKRQSALLQVSEAHLAILPDEDGDTPLHLSIIHENVRLTQHLVKLIVGVYMNLDIANNMRQTPLHLAIITRQPHIVQMLVQAGASVNFPDRKGNTALHLAAARRDMQVLQILARATSPVPDFNCKNFAGLAPVHLATRESSIDVLKFLFQLGANKNAMDACSGRTPLHYAVEAENFILVNFLLESGCNVNSATFSGNTPLHIAAGRRLKEIVALLMAYGANPALANGEGDFPTDLPASLLMQRARMNAH